MDALVLSHRDPGPEANCYTSATFQARVSYAGPVETSTRTESRRESQPESKGGKPARGRTAAGGYANGRARRRAIVQAAAEHFAVSGFNGATVRDIAAAVGISRAGLMRHFESKEALLQQVLEDRDERDREHFTPYARVPGGIGILRGMIDLAERNERTPGMINLFIRLSVEAFAPEHPAHGYFRKRYADIRDGTARTLRSAAAKGYLRPGVDPEGAAVRLTAVMDGLQTQWVLDPDIAMSSQVRAAITELLTAEGIEALARATPAE